MNWIEALIFSYSLFFSHQEEAGLGNASTNAARVGRTIGFARCNDAQGRSIGRLGGRISIVHGGFELERGFEIRYSRQMTRCLAMFVLAWTCFAPRAFPSGVSHPVSTDYSAEQFRGQQVNFSVQGACLCSSHGTGTSPLPSQESPGHNSLPALKNYVDILEKTNTQLSLWYNPYGILIAALSALFGVGAVVLGYYVYRQGNDFRTYARKQADNYFQSFEKLRSNFEQIGGEHIEFRQKVEATINALIEESKATLDELKGDARSTIEKQIERLDQVKKDLATPSVPPVKPEFYATSSGAAVSGLSGYAGHSGIGSISIKCEGCGHRFLASNPLLYGTSLGGARPHANCPKCNYLNLF